MLGLVRGSIENAAVVKDLLDGSIEFRDITTCGFLLKPWAVNHKRVLLNRRKPLNL